MLETHTSSPADEPVYLDRYRLLERIAIGGMAEVYLADMQGPLGFRRRVAIKRILPHLAREKDFVHAFVDEARVGGALVHPNIVQLLDFNLVDDIPYIAMEYVEGGDLATIVRRARERGAMPPPNILHALFLQAVRGVDFAHRARDADGLPLRLIHRDIKPTNLLLGLDGQVRIADFGVAKASSNLTQTLPDVVKGSLPFMSPEQASGSNELTQASDQFSLGAVLFELLTLEQLYPPIGNAVGLLGFVARGPEAGRLTILENIPGEAGFMLPVVRRLLEIRPEDRYPDAAALVADLEMRCNAPPSPAALASFASEWLEASGADTARAGGPLQLHEENAREEERKRLVIPSGTTRKPRGVVFRRELNEFDIEMSARDSGYLAREAFSLLVSPSELTEVDDTFVEPGRAREGRSAGGPAAAARLESSPPEGRDVADGGGTMGTSAELGVEEPTERTTPQRSAGGATMAGGALETGLSNQNATSDSSVTGRVPDGGDRWHRGVPGCAVTSQRVTRGVPETLVRARAETPRGRREGRRRPLRATKTELPRTLLGGRPAEQGSGRPGRLRAAGVLSAVTLILVALVLAVWAGLEDCGGRGEGGAWVYVLSDAPGGTVFVDGEDVGEVPIKLVVSRDIVAVDITVRDPGSGPERTWSGTLVPGKVRVVEFEWGEPDAHTWLMPVGSDERSWEGSVSGENLEER